MPNSFNTLQQPQGSRLNTYQSRHQFSQTIQNQKRPTLGLQSQMNGSTHNFQASKHTRYNDERSNYYNILDELRQEYQILQTLPHQTHFQQNSKMDHSKHSKKNTSLQESKKVRNDDYDMLLVEKRNLEIVIGNSMKKIQELLEKENQYKKELHELRLQIEGKGGLNAHHKREIKNHIKRQEELEHKIQMLQQELAKMAANEPFLSQRIHQLEREIELKNRLLVQEKADSQRMEDELNAQKNRFQQVEYENKKIRLEMEMYEKSKESQIRALRQEVDEYSRAKPSGETTTIKRLEHEIKIKNQQLVEFERLLMSEKNRPVPQPVPVVSQKDEITPNMMQAILKATIDKKTENHKHYDSMNKIITRLESMPQKEKDGQLRSEIQGLRREVEFLQTSRDVRKQKKPDNRLEKNRINELERKMRDESEAKRKLMEELKITRSQYELLETRHREVNFQLEESMRKQTFEEESEDMVKKSQYEQLLQKYHEALQRIKALERENDSLREELQRKPVEVEVIKNVTNTEELRMLTRQLDEANFTSEKYRIEKEKQVQWTKDQSQHSLQEQAKNIDHLKLLLKQKDQQFFGHNTAILQQREHMEREIEKLKDEKRQLISRNEQMYRKQVHKLNEEASHRIGQLQRVREVEITELRSVLHKNFETNKDIDHLWSIKQAEYGNLNAMLESMNMQSPSILNSGPLQPLINPTALLPPPQGILISQ